MEERQKKLCNERKKLLCVGRCMVKNGNFLFLIFTFFNILYIKTPEFL